MVLNTTEGPCRIKDSNIDKTTSVLEPVRLRIGTDGPAAIEPRSVPGVFRSTVEQYGSRAAIASRDPQGLWNYVTYEQYRDISLHITKVFIKLGLEPRHSVGILAFNCPEWFYSSMGAIHANGISVGIYTTNSSDAVYHVLENSKANIVVVDDTKQMAKIREIKHKLPLLRAAIQIEEPFDDSLREEDGYYRWTALKDMDTSGQEEELERRLKDIAINECCSIIYTSGTTGMPKGVMLSHDNIIWDAQCSVNNVEGLEPGAEIIVSYLPLSHVAAMNADLYFSLIAGTTVHFADRNALKGSLAKTLAEVRPTIFGGVPRVFEKIQEKMLAIESRTGFLKRSVLSWAKSCALDYRTGVMNGNDYEGLQYRLAKTLILDKIKRALGLDRCKKVFCGAAPLSLDTQKFFLSIDLHILQIYGLSENAAAHCMCTLRTPYFDTVGKGMPGTETKIVDPDEAGHGEICFRGRHVFMGYVDDEDKTNQALDDEGWMHTGDIGYIDDEGYVFITGRLKELIITAGGENIPPVRIEDLVKNELRVLSNCMLIGDKRKYLTVLVTLKTHMNLETGAPLDTLHAETLKWLSELDLPYKTLTEVLEAGPCPKVMEEITKAVTRANKHAISNAQKVQKFAILPHDFSIPTGELGPTLKLKRNEVVKIHADIIDGLYKE